MERRAETRIPWNCPVRVTLLGGPPQHFDATLVNVSGRGARLKLDQPLACDSIIRVDLENGMLLGEVCYCASDGDGFGVGVELEHSLLNLAEVTRMRNRVLEEDNVPVPSPSR
jgi:PilZ domain-containing protein